MIRTLFYKLPPQLRYIVRYLVFLPYDMVTTLFGSNKRLSPPKRLIFIGSGDFVEIGDLFQQDFIDKGVLTPSSSVLDVGCGIGRSAIPMTTYLEGGSYDGFDIMKPGINWCKKNISKQYPNFNFKLVDLTNDLYKSSGSAAENFTFPYKDASFDLSIVLSVFTHLIQDEVEQYLSEISRVLKTNGACYATFFLLNDDSTVAMQTGDHEFNFKYSKGNYSLLNKEVRSANVAFDENYLFNTILSNCNLKVRSLKYGSWSKGGGGSPIAFQDCLVLEKIN